MTTWGPFYAHDSTSYPLAFSLAVCQYVDMECIYCSAPTKVTNSRPHQKTPGIWRRRKCLGCGAIFTSREAPDYDKSLVVKQSNAKLVPFERDKLFSSLLAVCGHRQHAVKDSTALTATIIQKLVPKAQDGLLTKQQIIETTAQVLKRFDAAAAVQYDAYHPL